MTRWIAAVLLAVAPTALAQSAAVELVENPMVIEAAGLTIYPPADARTQTVRVGDQPTVQILSADSTWMINITAPRTTDGTLDAAGVADSVARQLVSSGGTFKGKIDRQGRLEGDFKDSKIKIIERTDSLIISGIEAERFYASVPAGTDAPTVIQGYTVFKIAPTRFCIMELITTEPEFDRVKGIYATVVGTARFADQAALAEGRKLAVRAGTRLLDELTEDEYLAALAAANGPDEKGRWERLFANPVENGAAIDQIDYGYRRVRAYAGKRGELNTGRQRADWRARDHQTGYIVQIDSRFLDHGRVVDSKGMFFMTPDRNEEAWSLTVAVRDAENPRAKPDVYTEVGAREGMDLTVRTEGPGIAPRTVKPVFQTDGYITQIERYILGPLLLQKKKVADYAFYAWNSAADPPAVTLMRASLSAPDVEDGYWEVETRPTETQEPQHTSFRDDGEAIITVLPDNPILGRRMWEPVALQELARIWREKGLPMN